MESKEANDFESLLIKLISNVVVQQRNKING